jgi:hypothetical protein
MRVEGKAGLDGIRVLPDFGPTAPVSGRLCPEGIVTEDVLVDMSFNEGRLGKVRAATRRLVLLAVVELLSLHSSRDSLVVRGFEGAFSPSKSCNNLHARMAKVAGLDRPVERDLLFIRRSFSN